MLEQILFLLLRSRIHVNTSLIHVNTYLVQADTFAYESYTR